MDTKKLWIELLKSSGGEVPENYKDIVDTIGIDAAIKLCDSFGGSSLYVPTLRALAREVVAEQVNKEYDGCNCRQLAIKYGFSSRTVNTMVHDK